MCGASKRKSAESQKSARIFFLMTDGSAPAAECSKCSFKLQLGPTFFRPRRLIWLASYRPSSHMNEQQARCG